MRSIGVICEDCKKIFTIDADKLAYYRNYMINPYTCPSCHSINCRNMNDEEINEYNSKIDEKNKKSAYTNEQIIKIKNKLKELKNKKEKENTNNATNV